MGLKADVMILIQAVFWLSFYSLATSAEGGHGVDVEDDVMVQQRHFPPRKGTDKIAVCLIGEARHFEINGPSIERHLVGTYKNSDLYVFLRLDENSWKLSLLSPHPSFAFLHVEEQQPLDPSAHPTHILSVPSIQGQLQQFFKIERCAERIREHEKEEGGELYDWILWTRLDSYWSAPPPEIQALNATAYTIPPGTDWGGFNDRLGIGPRDLALAAMERISLLPHLARRGYSELNGEKSLQRQLEIQNIPVVHKSVDFCILSFKRKRFANYPFARLGTASCLNGISCRPCNRFQGDMCRANTGYEVGWWRMYDKLMGEEGAGVRKAFTRVDEACLRGWEGLKSSFREYVGPTAEDICELGKHAKRHHLKGN